MDLPSSNVHELWQVCRGQKSTGPDREHVSCTHHPRRQSGSPYNALQWRHNECDGVSNHRHLHCLFNCLFRRRSKKAPKLRVTGLCEGNPPMTGGFPYKGPVTRKMFPFDDFIMIHCLMNQIDRSICRYTTVHHNTILNVAMKWSTWCIFQGPLLHYIDVIMTTMASQISGLTVVYSILCSGTDRRKHQSSASLAFVRGIHRDRWIPRTKGQ